MKIGISTASLYGKMYTEEALAYFAAHHVECAEVFLASNSEYTASFGDKLLSAKGDVDVYSIHTLNSQFEPQLFSRSQRQLDDALEIFRGALATGQKLGARVYVLHGPQQLKYVKFVTDYAFYGARTAELAKIAQDYGIMLTWENVHWTHYNHPYFMRNLLPYVGDVPVGNTLDIKQAMQSGVLVDQYITDMQGRLKNVHVVDMDEENHLLLPGRGLYCFPGLFEKLGEYDGAVMIEVYDGCYKMPEELLESYAWLREQAKPFIGGNNNEI